MPSVNVLNELQIKQNGITYTYKMSVISGYYNSADGKFYVESTYKNEIRGLSDFIYADLSENVLYIYKTTTSSFVKVSGEGSATENIKFGYLNEADGKFYEDAEYTTEIIASADNLYVGLDNNTIYRYDTAETGYVSIGGSGGSYSAGAGIVISNEKINIKPDNTTIIIDANNRITGNYQGGHGVKVDGNLITDKAFIGTSAEWDTLTEEQKAEFDSVNITDDGSTLNNTPGHIIKNETSSLPQRSNLQFEGMTITDDSTNDVTKVTSVPYTAGDGINIVNKEISVSDEFSRTWTGTKAQWDAIVDKSIYNGWIVNITDDNAVGTVVDTIANGNMNAVTSNAVYNNIKTTIIKIKNITWTGEGHTLDSVPLNAEIISVIPNINAAVFPYRIEHTWAFYEVKKWDASATTYDVTVTYRSTI